MADLLDKRLAFVTGKGGVGKTTLAYALGLAAAARGKRVIVCEIASQERGSRIFGRAPIGFSEAELAEHLWGISIDPERAGHEYLEVQLPLRAMSELLNRSKLFGTLAAATPGLAELVTIGKAWELTLRQRKSPDAPRTYDLVIVDAPATGHGVGFLQAPASFREMARVGPLAHQAERIDATLRDDAFTGVAIVTTAEEMAVNESISLLGELGGEGGFAVDLLVANGLHPERFSPGELQRLEGASPDAPGAASEALEAALEEARRATAQRRQLERLRELYGGGLTELPFVSAPRLGATELERLAGELG